MAHVITRLCDGVCDTACVDVCPVDCIFGPVTMARIREARASHTPLPLDGVQLFIDPDVCIDCGACAPECPVNAIFLDDDVPPEFVADIERNEVFFG